MWQLPTKYCTVHIPNNNPQYILPLTARNRHVMKNVLVIAVIAWGLSCISPIYSVTLIPFVQSSVRLVASYGWPIVPTSPV